MSTYFKLGALIEGVNTTATSGGTTNLSSTDKTVQQFTGSQNHTVKLPDATTVSLNRRFDIQNRSTGTITVTDSTGATITTISANSQLSFVSQSNGTAAGSWAQTNATGGGSGSGQAITNADELKMLQALASSTKVNDGTIVSSPLTLNPESAGADYFIQRAGRPVTGIGTSPFVLNGFLFIGQSGTNPNNERYSDDGNFWIERSNLAFTAAGGAGFTANGFGFYFGNDTANTRAYKYNDSTNTWSSGLTIYSGGSWIQMARFVNPVSGFAHFMGGSLGGTLNIAYDAANDVYYTRTPMSTSRLQGVSGAVLNDYGYIMGGVNGSPLTTTERLDFLLNAWRASATMNVARSQNTSWATGGFLFTAFNGSAVATAEKFNETVGAWSAISSSTAGRADNYNGGLTYNEYGYSLCGSTSGGTTPSTVNERYVAFSFFDVKGLKQTTASPTSILLAIAASSLVRNVPVQLRTDGDSWKNLTSNDSTSVLKLNEAVAAKFSPSGIGYMVGGWNSPTAYAINEAYNDQQNTWTVRQPLPAVRDKHAPFALNGKGYVPGGTPDNNETSDVLTNYAYDSQLNTWTTKNNILSTRDEAGGASLNGFGYIVGGLNSSTTMLNTTDRYNDALDSWTTLSATLNTTKWVNQATFNLNGRILSCGGSTTTGGNATSDVEGYDDASNVWTTLGGLAIPAWDNIGFGLQGYGYCVSGSSTGTDPSNATQQYNPTTNAWSNIASVGTKHSAGTGFFMNGFGYAAGGLPATAVTEQYNNGSNSWTTKASTSQARWNAGVGFTPGQYRNYDIRIGIPAMMAGAGALVWINRSSMITGKGTGSAFDLADVAYCAGGLAGTSTIVSETQRYVYATDTWIQDTAMPQISQTPGSGPQTLQGLGYCIGGYNGTSRIANSVQYSDVTRVWTAVASYPAATNNINGAPLNGYLLMAGGVNTAATTATYQYNPTSNLWTSKASMSSTWTSGCGFPLNGLFYVLGGLVAGAYSPAMTRYNDVADAWTAMASYPGSTQYYSALFSAPNGMLSAGGYVNSVVSTSSAVYNDANNTWSVTQSLNTAVEGSFMANIQGQAVNMGGTNASNVGAANTQVGIFSVKNAILGYALEVK